MTLGDQKLITCILPKGIAPGVLKILREKHEIISANINSARGMGKITPLKYRGVGGQSEKEILTVVVGAEQADDIFELIYFEANVNSPHGGLIYVHPLLSATPYTLPDLPPEG